MFLAASVSTSGCFPDVLMVANLTYQLISNRQGLLPPVVQTRQLMLRQFFPLKGSDLCNILLRVTPDCSTTLILKPASFISLMYRSFSCDPGVAGTKVISNTGITYELVCQVCHHQYIGETSRSAYTRGKEHLRALEQREETSVMWRHSCDTGMFHNDAMLRQITESVRINKVEEGQLINTKGEWSYFRTPRAVVTQT